MVLQDLPHESDHRGAPIFSGKRQKFAQSFRILSLHDAFPAFLAKGDPKRRAGQVEMLPPEEESVAKGWTGRKRETVGSEMVDSLLSAGS